MAIKWRQAAFGLIADTIPFPRILACKCSLKAVMEKFIPKMIGQQTPISNKAVIMVMEKLPILM